MDQEENEGMGEVTEKCSGCDKIFPQSQLMINKGMLYCTVYCLKNAQNTKNDSLEAYAMLIRELRELEPIILANLELEEKISKIKP